MRILWTVKTKDERSFTEKVSLFLFILLKSSGEGYFIGLGEREGERSQLLSCISLGSSREILSYRLQLMKLTHLDWNILEYIG